MRAKTKVFPLRLSSNHHMSHSSRLTKQYASWAAAAHSSLSTVSPPPSSSLSSLSEDEPLFSSQTSPSHEFLLLQNRNIGSQFLLSVSSTRGLPTTINKALARVTATLKRFSFATKPRLYLRSCWSNEFSDRTVDIMMTRRSWP